MTVAEYNNCVQLHADGVYRYIVKSLKLQADAQDIVQSSFEKLWIHRENVTPSTSKAYLYTVAYNQMIDHIRKHRKITLVHELEHMSNTSVAPQHMHLKEALQHALDQLSEVQRSLVLLKDYEGYSYQEIGTIMNLTESQVKVYLHRARLQLRSYIVKADNVL